MKAKVYVGMSADYIHVGHINLINKASKYGNVIVGLLTDEAIASYKRVPMCSFDNRKKLVENIKGVTKVISQKTLDYTDNLIKIKPEYVVHGDDWKVGVQANIREKVIETLNQWNGKLIEVPYTEGISSTSIIEGILKKGITPDFRRSKLKKLIELKPIVRVLEAHSGLSGKIVENTKIINNSGVDEFDAIWISSLTDSTSKGKPDTEVVDFTSRVNTINEILEVTTKPLIVDGDTGGLTEHFVFMVKTLERLGVSAVIIEDKKFPKRNSLLDDNSVHIQEDKDIFASKIIEGKKAQVTDDFMIIARIESLILGKSINDAIERAKTYINAGADAIMIHSKDKNPDKILEFCSIYNKLNKKVPLVVVPTTYNSIKESELIENGCDIVIYANHLLRSSYKAMKEVAIKILKNKRCYEVDDMCCDVKELFDVIK